MFATGRVPRMKCSKVRMLLSAMLDGELGRSEKEAVLRHVGSCERCRRELEELRRLRDLLSALPSEPLPLGVRMNILSAVGADLSAGPVSCEEVRQALHLLLEGGAPEAVERAVRAHLDICQGCAREFEELRRSVELVRSLPKVEPPDWVVDPSRYVERVGRPLWGFSWALRPVAFATATAAFVALMVLGIWRGVAIRGPEEVAIRTSKRATASTTVQRPMEAPAPYKGRVSEAPVSKPVERASVTPSPERRAKRGVSEKRVQKRKGTSLKEVALKPKPSPRRASKRGPTLRATPPSKPEKEEEPASSTALVVIKRSAPSEGGGPSLREIQKEEIQGEIGRPEAEGMPLEPSTEGEGPKVELAMEKGPEGIEIVSIEF